MRPKRRASLSRQVRKITMSPEHERRPMMTNLRYNFKRIVISSGIKVSWVRKVFNFVSKVLI
jgi:hypothetical protein